MSLLKLGPDELLTTTRAVRLRLDLQRPVARSLIEECVEISQQAPTGGNQQTWAFVVVTDQEKRAALGALYKQGWEAYLEIVSSRAPASAAPRREILRVYRSAQYLADHMGEVPVLVIPCIAGRVKGESHEEHAGQWGSDPAGDMELHAGGQSAGPGDVLDNPPFTPRAGGRRDSRDTL